MEAPDKITQLERCSGAMRGMLESHHLSPTEYARIVDSVVNLEMEIRRQKTVAKYNSKKS